MKYASKRISRLISSKSSEIGTITLQMRPAETVISVIGTDTSPSATPPEIKPAKEKKTKTPNCPTYIINKMSCCGLADVHGIENAYNGNYTDDLIFLGFTKTLADNRKAWEAVVGRYNNGSDDPLKQLQLSHEYYNFKGLTKLPAAFVLSYRSRERSLIFPRFEAFVKQHELGTITETPNAYNENSGNQINVLIWTIDHGNYNKLLQSL